MASKSLRDPRWLALVPQIKARDGHTCVSCGATTSLQVDHIVPLDAFTQEMWDNEQQYDPDWLQTLCLPCNARKGNKVQPTRKQWFSDRWLKDIA